MISLQPMQLLFEVADPINRVIQTEEARVGWSVRHIVYY